MNGTDTDGLFALPDIEVDARDAGVRVLRSRDTLRAGAGTLAAMLRERAAAHPERPLLVERDGAGAWRTVTFGGMLTSATAIGQALLDRGLGPGRSVMALSGNSIAHAQLMFGCYFAGVPFTPTSVAYSLISSDHAKLRHVADKVRPAMAFAEAVAPFWSAITDAFDPSVEVDRKSVV